MNHSKLRWIFHLSKVLGDSEFRTFDQCKPYRQNILVSYLVSTAEVENDAATTGFFLDLVFHILQSGLTQRGELQVKAIRIFCCKGEVLKC